uniref:Uncharacterized protein n=1 Tax=Myoviridae sp. ctQQg4 TaxID=2827686 RepID=A0A8S5T7Z5_9CAUD|nr:MAG TPA: hypothetical protein [Myoviridae sp. ctQQg4]
MRYLVACATYFCLFTSNNYLIIRLYMIVYVL